MPVSETSYVGWNKTRAIIVNTTYQNRKSYYERYGNDYSTVTMDSTVVVMVESKKSNEAIAGKNEELAKTVEKGSKLNVLNLKTTA